MDRLLAAFDRILGRVPRVPLLAGAAAALAVVGALDYVTGSELSLALLYVPPVAAAAWYAGRPSGLAMAALASVVWLVADRLALPMPHPAAISVWNAAVRLGLFALTAELLCRVRETLARERRLARTDALTGLLHRRSFEERLAHDLELARRWRGVLTVAYLDVDDFKGVNDSHGHPAGDRALRRVGEVLTRATRRADSVARLGGDEFALVLPDTDSSGAEHLMERLRQDLAAAFADEPFAVSCSIGVVTFVEPPRSVEEAIAAADGLMYRVKRAGKGAAAFEVLASARFAPQAEGTSGH